MPHEPRRRHQFIDRRKAQGFSQETLGLAMGVSLSAVAQWERGITTPTPGHRPKLAELLEVSLDELDLLLDADVGPIDLHGHPVPHWLDHVGSLEQGAGEIRSVELLGIPGLLQTVEYATEVMRNHYRPLSAEHIRARVAARLARQAVLEREPEPLVLRALIDESVLLRATGSDQVLAAQFEHLLAMAERPNIHFQILPLTGVTHTTGFGSFTLLTKQGEAKPFMICTENASSVRYEEYPEIVADHVRLFDHLEAVAMSPAQSIERVELARRRNTTR